MYFTSCAARATVFLSAPAFVDAIAKDSVRFSPVSLLPLASSFEPFYFIIPHPSSIPSLTRKVLDIHVYSIKSSSSMPCTRLLGKCLGLADRSTSADQRSQEFKSLY
ncbi:hypothetical protein BOTBODRAFT_475782 [Botryobasidium botryosum FD-172 SS1]|uniref:Uncharacterized protein n=1 Tax=Botryobasidium botryosum (strain FD-172 SS1) TaxID=930990 RepID=A0A067MSS4_BOTB1|nr:hypothetical protein BOTBODRAFT_475782 [Botryobasidium botryosum FD-172 SS1]